MMITRSPRRLGGFFPAALALLLAVAPGPIGAQDHQTTPAAPSSAAQAESETHADVGVPEKVDIITPHITDGYHMELPYWKPPFYREICLGRHVGEHGCEPLWAPVHIGGMTLQLSPTKHVVMLLLAATLCTIVLVGAARAHARHTHAVGRPRGFAAGIEGLVSPNHNLSGTSYLNSPSNSLWARNATHSHTRPDLS